MNDRELLQRYAFSRHDAPFTKLVTRHVDHVYSAALRQVGGDAHLAQDVTLAVEPAWVQKFLAQIPAGITTLGQPR